MRIVIALMASLLLVSLAIAQVSPEEATEKLKEKQREREASAAKPAQITQGELDKLKSELIRLRAQVAELKKENDSLKAKTAKPVDPKKPGAKAPLTTKVDDYLKDNKVDDKIALKMRHFIPAVGMTQAQLDLMIEAQNGLAKQGVASKRVESENETEKVIIYTFFHMGEFSPYAFRHATWIRDGKCVQTKLLGAVPELGGGASYVFPSILGEYIEQLPRLKE